MPEQRDTRRGAGATLGAMRKAQGGGVIPGLKPFVATCSI